MQNFGCRKMIVNAESVGLCKKMIMMHFKDVNGSLIRLTSETEWQLY